MTELQWCRMVQELAREKEMNERSWGNEQNHGNLAVIVHFQRLVPRC